MSAHSEAALQWAKPRAHNMMQRKGHGGGAIVYRQITEAQLIALLAIAFDAGRNSATE